MCGFLAAAASYSHFKTRRSWSRRARRNGRHGRPPLAKTIVGAGANVPLLTLATPATAVTSGRSRLQPPRQSQQVTAATAVTAGHGRHGSHSRSQAAADYNHCRRGGANVPLVTARTPVTAVTSGHGSHGSHGSHGLSRQSWLAVAGRASHSPPRRSPPPAATTATACPRPHQRHE